MIVMAQMRRPTSWLLGIFDVACGSRLQIVTISANMTHSQWVDSMTTSVVLNNLLLWYGVRSVG